MNPTISPEPEPTDLTLLAIERLLTVKAAILSNPEWYDQMKVGTPGETDLDHPYGTECGSASCIFGWACYIFEPESLMQPYQCNVSEWTFEKGAGLLRLERNASEESFHQDTQASRLYDIDRWPREFQYLYNKAEGHKARARVAADRIDHFIATDGDE